jgi:hypothetical protein
MLPLATPPPHATDATPHATTMPHAHASHYMLATGYAGDAAILFFRRYMPHAITPHAAARHMIHAARSTPPRCHIRCHAPRNMPRLRCHATLPMLHAGYVITPCCHVADAVTPPYVTATCHMLHAGYLRHTLTLRYMRHAVTCCHMCYMPHWHAGHAIAAYRYYIATRRCHAADDAITPLMLNTLRYYHRHIAVTPPHADPPDMPHVIIATCYMPHATCHTCMLTLPCHIASMPHTSPHADAIRAYML